MPHAARCLSVLVLATACLPAQQRPAARANAARATNELAFALLQQLPEGNLVFSPAGIRAALAACLPATADGTRAELSRLCGLPGDAALQELQQLELDLLAVNRDGSELQFAHRLWAAQRRAGSYAPDAGTLLRDRQGAAFEIVDFAATRDAETRIQGWLAAATVGATAAPRLAGTLDGDTGLVLTSASGFTGQWDEPFDALQSVDQPFRLDGGRRVQVPTMQRSGSIAMASADGVTGLALPYAGRVLRLLVLLPDDGDLGRLQAELDAARLQRWRARLQEQTMQVQLPRVTLQNSCALHDRVLPALGLRAPFASSRDFRPLLRSGEALRLGIVHHEASVALDEGGTAAGGSTGILLRQRSGAMPRLAVDRPFLFAIEHEASGAIVFLGRVVDPRRRG